MSIIEEHLPKLSNIELKFKQNSYPICPQKGLPKLYFLCLALGSRGSGKTYSICKLIRMYEMYGLYLKNKKIDIRTILISPTYHANPVYTSLNSLELSDVHEHYSDELLESILNDIKQEKLNTEEYKIKMKFWNKCIKKDPNELTHEEILELEKMGFQEPEKPRFPNGVANFLLFDDCVGSTMLKSIGPSKFTKFCIANRHVNCSVIIMSQGIKSIPKVIRNNTSLFIIFRFASSKIITEDLYSEVSNTTTLENFEKLFTYATKNDHDALVIDLSQPKAERFKQNFDKILTINS